MRRPSYRSEAFLRLRSARKAAATISTKPTNGTHDAAAEASEESARITEVASAEPARAAAWARGPSPSVASAPPRAPTAAPAMEMSSISQAAPASAPATAAIAIAALEGFSSEVHFQAILRRARPKRASMMEMIQKRMIT